MVRQHQTANKKSAYMNHVDIRALFFRFFTELNHKKIESSPVIPGQDPTILFTNAGMNQFKDVFLGKEKKGYNRAVTIQKCIRAGGKHNDLDNVGFTDRHLTFFEMMGNFSFGDYFKKDAILYAWQFLTQELLIDKEKLYVTIYEDDQESREIWKHVSGFPDKKITNLGADTNFWQMGDIGPCGPCSEIFYDRGSEFGCKDEKTCKKAACDCGRYLEIWNLVFMQFERQIDGTLKPLKNPGVDTGMGLERLCLVMQNKPSVFLTDLFTPIIREIENLSGKTYEEQDSSIKAAFHVLVDHIRSVSFIIADGTLPSNEGRGYVLRKIIRRAVLFSQKLSKETIFPKLVTVFADIFQNIYPEIKQQKEHITLVLESETEKFAVNVLRGSEILARFFLESEKSKIISGSQAFKLYDTYGFPLELVIAACREKNYKVDEEEFEKFMQEQQEKSGKKKTDTLDLLHPDFETEFTGYEELETESHIVSLVFENNVVTQVPAGVSCYVLPKKSPFFIVGGGQVPDKGTIKIKDVTLDIREVRYIDNAIAILVETPISLKSGDIVVQKVDYDKRIYAMKNHTATHLLQAALIEYFGSSIKQAGSLVHPDYLRFDFNFQGNIKDEDIFAIEKLVNKKIQKNIPVSAQYMTLQEAAKKGALAFFGDKYNAEKVRVIAVDDFSVELCGGTHVKSTGDIGFFKITDVLALAAGQKRIHALTGLKSVECAQENFLSVKQLAQEFKVKREEVVAAVFKQKTSLKDAEKAAELYKKELMKEKLPNLIKEIQKIKEVPVGVFEFENFSLQDLKETAQLLLQKEHAYYMLFTKEREKTLLFAICAPEYKEKINLQHIKTCLEKTFNFRGGMTQETMQGSITSTTSINKNDVLKCISSSI